jgi:3-oxoacyl-[acyl-carrier protein] reductase
MWHVVAWRAAHSLLPSTGGGSISTAISAIQPLPLCAVIGHLTVIGFAKTLSLEVAAERQRHRLPGYIETKRLEKVFAAGPGTPIQPTSAEAPMGLIGTLADIASLVSLLVSPRGRYITGTAVQVDGGLLRAVR